LKLNAECIEQIGRSVLSADASVDGCESFHRRCNVECRLGRAPALGEGDPALARSVTVLLDRFFLGNGDERKSGDFNIGELRPLLECGVLGFDTCDKADAARGL